MKKSKPPTKKQTAKTKTALKKAIHKLVLEVNKANDFVVNIAMIDKTLVKDILRDRTLLAKRKHPPKIEHEPAADQWIQGFACACGIVGYINSVSEAQEVMKQGGFNIEDFRKAQAEEIDINRVLYGASEKPESENALLGISKLISVCEKHNKKFNKLGKIMAEGFMESGRLNNKLRKTLGKEPIKLFESKKGAHK